MVNKVFEVEPYRGLALFAAHHPLILIPLRKNMCEKRKILILPTPLFSFPSVHHFISQEKAFNHLKLGFLFKVELRQESVFQPLHKWKWRSPWLSFPRVVNKKVVCFHLFAFNFGRTLLFNYGLLSLVAFSYFIIDAFCIICFLFVLFKSPFLSFICFLCCFALFTLCLLSCFVYFCRSIILELKG